MCPWPRADFFQVNAIAVYRLMLEWLSCIVIFGQDHVATCIFASDVAAGVFFCCCFLFGSICSWENAQLVVRGLVLLDLFYREDIYICLCLPRMG